MQISGEHDAALGSGIEGGVSVKVGGWGLRYRLGLFSLTYKTNRLQDDPRVIVPNVDPKVLLVGWRRVG